MQQPQLANPNRIVALLDLDCFYAQVEHNRFNVPRDVPLAVQQWNALIAVNYVAKDLGVKRMDSVETAKRKAPGIVFVHTDLIDEDGRVIQNEEAKALSGRGVRQGRQTPQADEVQKKFKVSLRQYRQESFKILRVLCSFTDAVQRASIDEAYVDLTELVEERLGAYQGEYTADMWHGVVLGGAFAPQSEVDVRMCVASQIVAEMREAVRVQLNYFVSAGIARSRIFSKVISSMNKPDNTTILPPRYMPELLRTVPLRKLHGFGGKLGKRLLAAMDVETAMDVRRVSSPEHLRKFFSAEDAMWIWKVCHGVDDSSVRDLKRMQSFTAGKAFGYAITNWREMWPWVRVCVAELIDRTEEEQVLNKRRPRTLSVHMKGVSRSCPLPSFSLSAEQFREQVLKSVRQLIESVPNALPARGVHMAFSNFEDTAGADASSKMITQFFEAGAEPVSAGEAMKGKRKGKKRKKRGIVEMWKGGGSSSSSAEAAAAAAGGGVMFKCRCGAEMPESHRQLHEDYHLAEEMQRKERKLAKGVVEERKESKRKKKKVDVKSIRSFFKLG